MLGQVALLVLTAILGSFALDQVGNGNIGDQTNVSGDPTGDVVSASGLLPPLLPVRFRNEHLKTCIEISDGDGLKLARCDLLQPQLWLFESGRLRNLENDKCMEMKENGTVFVAECDTLVSQQWTGGRVGFKGELVNFGPEKCVDLKGTLGIVGQQCSGKIEQVWERIL